MSLPAADSYPPPPPPLRPPPPPPPLPPPPPPSVIRTRAHERCHCHPCRRVPPQCRITSAPGHQNGAGSAHAHHADPGGRRSRSCGSPIRLSSEPAPRRAARLSRGFGRVAPPCRRLGRGGCGFRAGQRGLGLAGPPLALRPLSREARSRGGSPTWRVPQAPPGLSPALTLPDPEPTGLRCLPVSNRGKSYAGTRSCPASVGKPPREIHCRSFCSGTMITQLLFGHLRYYTLKLCNGWIPRVVLATGIARERPVVGLKARS